MTKRPKSPISGLIEKAVRCTLCGAGFGVCDCWASVSCARCSVEFFVERAKTKAEVLRGEVRVFCWACHQGGSR